MSEHNPPFAGETQEMRDQKRIARQTMEQQRLLRGGAELRPGVTRDEVDGELIRRSEALLEQCRDINSILAALPAGVYIPDYIFSVRNRLVSIQDAARELWESVLTDEQLGYQRDLVSFGLRREHEGLSLKGLSFTIKIPVSNPT